MSWQDLLSALTGGIPGYLGNQMVDPAYSWLSGQFEGAADTIDQSRYRASQTPSSPMDALSSMTRTETAREAARQQGEYWLTQQDNERERMRQAANTVPDVLFPGLSDYLDEGSWRPEDLFGAVANFMPEGSAATTGLPLAAGAVNRFANRPVLVDQMAKIMGLLVGEKEAGAWGRFLKRIPQQESPALRAAERTYDVLGIRGRPDLQSRLGPEVELAAQVETNELARRIDPFWAITHDRSVKTKGVWDHPYELIPREDAPPLVGLGGLKRLHALMEPLTKKYADEKLTYSGPRIHAGAHWSISNPAADLTTYSNMLGLYMQHLEPVLTPRVTPDVNTHFGQRTAKFARPTFQIMEPGSDLTIEPGVFKALFENPNMEHFQHFDHLPTRYMSVNVRNLQDPLPLRRLEFRAFDGSVDPNDWISRALPLELMMQAALKGEGRAFVGRPHPDFMRNYRQNVLDLAPQIRKHRQKRGFIGQGDAWLDYLDKLTLNPNQPVEPLQPHPTPGPPIRLDLW